MRSTGQALLIVLLGMSVVLTVVISILSRSITDFSVTSKEQDSLRAFSAAEAGIENALLTGSFLGGSLDGANFVGSVTGIAGGSKYAYPSALASGESATVWLVGHDDTTGALTCAAGKNCFRGDKMKVCWGDLAANPIPALEITLFYDPTLAWKTGDFANVKVARFALDPSNSRRTTDTYPDNFTLAGTGSCSVGTKDFAYNQTLNFASMTPALINFSNYTVANGGYFLAIKFRMLYNSVLQTLGVDVSGASPGNSLPDQGRLIGSVGTIGEATRKVEVRKLYPELPSIFDYTVFSLGGSLGK